MKEIMDNLQTHFTQIFGEGDKPLCCFAPGRINLIGEHIDYNGGPVMPFSIDRGTFLLMRENRAHKHRFFSLNFPEVVFNIPVARRYQKEGERWINYPLGTIQMLMDRGIVLPSGMDFLYFGNIPHGAGMSSSASIEVVTLFGLNKYFNLGLTRLEIVQLAKKAENDFVGLSCGIMDQYAVTYGKEGHVILLDCSVPSHRFVRVDLGGSHEFVAINTCKRRGLTDSKYNERFAESMRALKQLKQEYPSIENLCDLSSEDFPRISAILEEEPLLWRRTRHVISEKERVFMAGEALERGDMKAMGACMNASHHSLRYDYETTGFELDSLVEILQRIPGVEGARVTGAGFGGCAIALAKKGVIQQSESLITQQYQLATALTPEFIPAAPSEGVSLKEC
ncbi:MAG: galactokinase [Bacteroidetes bacterium]|nr:MAG: galactokinase [Bacteroidota bacterium]PIE88558.1 MAG: galactokinase [Bacteroidota bacterium]